VESTRTDPDPDPKPAPPPRPEEWACCGNGCSPCILELYEMERERYEDRLRAWHERHPQAD
jgi:hypothetical protein